MSVATLPQHHTFSPPSPFPTKAALALEATPFAELDDVFMNGTTPDPEALVGWEFRGINRMPLNGVPWAVAAGIKKFVKGFYRGNDGRLMGYNVPVVCNALDGRWNYLPSNEAPKHWGFFEVTPVDATARDNKFLHAVLLDYGKGGNAIYDVMRGLRDYLVQVDPRNPDLYLGRAYYAVGPARLGKLNYFILERHRRA
jgi:hypothetical protein